jgi:hypothetical protein
MTQRHPLPLPYPERRPPPFKDDRNLTCPHGRFWSSCKRCQLPPETVQRNVAIRGESCHRLDEAFWPPCDEASP